MSAAAGVPYWLKCQLFGAHELEIGMKLTLLDKAFYRGVLLGLQHIRHVDCSVTYAALIKDAGPKQVVAVAKEEDALEWSGLLHYRWADKSGRCTPQRAQ